MIRLSRFNFSVHKSAPAWSSRLGVYTCKCATDGAQRSLHELGKTTMSGAGLPGALFMEVSRARTFSSREALLAAFLVSTPGVLRFWQGYLPSLGDFGVGLFGKKEFHQDASSRSSLWICRRHGPMYNQDVY